MRTAAILPVKTFAAAKQRLAAALGPDDRARLATAMVGDVLAALAAVEELDEIVVVTAEPAASAAAQAAGARVVTDPGERGQSPAAARGIAAATARGADRVLLVPGDCPALDPAELTALLERRASGRFDRPARMVVIVPDRHGQGTNALLLAPATVLAPAFGPGSFARHAASAAAAGATVRVAQLPSLQLDVDTAADLAALRVALDAHAGGAARTRAVLARLVGTPAVT